MPVPAAVAAYVLNRVEAPPGSYLFPSPQGTIWTNTNFRLRTRWTATTTSVGLAGTRIHDLRHTAASLLIAAGADVKAVQSILGHASATMTMDLYGHLFSEAPFVAIGQLPSFLEAVGNPEEDAPSGRTDDPDVQQV